MVNLSPLLALLDQSIFYQLLRYSTLSLEKLHFFGFRCEPASQILSNTLLRFSCSLKVFPTARTSLSTPDTCLLLGQIGQTTLAIEMSREYLFTNPNGILSNSYKVLKAVFFSRWVHFNLPVTRY